MQFLHSMIRVKNEDESLRFYCDLIGLKKGKRIRLEDCYLQYLTDEKTGVEIELTINDSIPKEGYKTGSAFGHFAFLCDDLDQFDKKMKEMGYDWETEPMYLKEVKTKIAFVLDPNNNAVELIERIN